MERTDPQGRRIPFHIAYLTADRSAWAVKKRLMRELSSMQPTDAGYGKLQEKINSLDVGGRIIEHSNCVIGGMRGIHASRSKGASTTLSGTSTDASASVESRLKKNPNHFRNNTRNILFLPSNQIRKLHINLIVFFNGKEVIF